MLGSPHSSPLPCMASCVSRGWLQPSAVWSLCCWRLVSFIVHKEGGYKLYCPCPLSPAKACGISAVFPAASTALVGKILYSVVIPLYRIEVVTSECGTAI